MFRQTVARRGSGELAIRGNTMERGGARLGYKPGLDAIRAFAIGVVVLSHLPQSPWLPATVGGPGVTVFFVLSGFLITRLLASELDSRGRIGVTAFWRRRAARLLPAAWLVVAVVTVVDPDPLRAFAASLYFANWVVAANHSIDPLSHYWSLAIEEQFYLVWPIVLPALRRPRVLLGLAVCVALWRTTQIDTVRAGYATDTQADALLIGAALALLPIPDVPRLAAMAALAAVALVDLDTSRVLGGLAVPIVIVASAVLIWCLLEWTPPRVIVHVGVISYGIYLVHPPLIDAFGWIGVPATLVVAELMYRFWEHPLRARLAGARIRGDRQAQSVVLVGGAAPPVVDHVMAAAEGPPS
jgi:peptidoglycan/LPS O-acetylase OafA/YrhL